MKEQDWFIYTSVMNALIANHPVAAKRGLLARYGVTPQFDESDVCLCLTCLKKSVYYAVYGAGSDAYIGLYLRNC